MTYQATHPWAKAIKAAVATKKMPSGLLIDNMEDSRMRNASQMRRSLI